ncbi:hypothetical protein Tco_1501560 [Tanacetum coccineum]
MMTILVLLVSFLFPSCFILLFTLSHQIKNPNKLNDLNEPFKLRRNQGDDLMPTIKKSEVIEEFRTRDDDLDTGIDDYPSYCDDDKKIHIDCAHNLKFSCMIGFEFTHANFFPLLYVNLMSRKIHNSIMKNKMVYNKNNIVGALMNVPIFVGTFFVMADFAVLENMDAYHDEGMGDVIFGEPFLREVGIKAKWFEGMITLYKGDDEITYQICDHIQAVPLEGLHVDDKLYLVEEPVEIMDREVKRLKQSRILIVKVRWNLRRGPEFTWEREDQFQKKYSHLFTKPVPSSTKLEVKTVRLKKLVLLAEVSTASKRPEEDPADHPIDGGDNDDNESSNDDDDDDDVVKDTKAFETDESFF